jgi:predicted metal-dependent hydrolase
MDNDTIRVGNHSIGYSIRYTKRKKTIGIHIVGTRRVEILSPRGVPLKEIEGVIRKKAEWILRKSSSFGAPTGGPGGAFEDGDVVLYLGEELPIRIDVRSKVKSARITEMGGKALSVPEVPEASEASEAAEAPECGPARGPKHAGRRSLLVRFFKREARRIIADRVAHYAPLMNVRPAKVLIKANRSNWGSCTPKNTLNFSYRLVMAPLEVVDYVVVHELAHLVVRGHSKAFWKVVAGHVGGVKEKRKWLREKGGMLTL